MYEEEIVINDIAKEVVSDIIFDLNHGDEISIDDVTKNIHDRYEEIMGDTIGVVNHLLEEEYGITDDDLFEGITKKELDERNDEV